jgi:histidinol dehydrogenase
MMHILDLRGEELTAASIQSQLPRPRIDVRSALSMVEPIVSAVALEGESALRQQALKFDGVSNHRLRVPLSERNAALKATSPEVIAALREAIRRVRIASTAQIPASTSTQISDGAIVNQRWQPVSRVGLYVPGGKAVYPSSVVMNVVPAQVAGVEHIALASPAQKEFGGSVHPTILAAAALLDITEIYAIGGAAAIAAFAYGVEEIDLEPVDVITGPGNIFVAAAKRLVNGDVGIDSEAGTTEILIIADDQANARFVAADLMSQAEHDEAAAAVLVTDSEVFASLVIEEIQALLPTAVHSQRIRTALDGPQSRIVVVDSLEAAAMVSNAYAPEHLELQVRSVDTLLQQITNAGVIFLGSHTPVAVGDYIAGSNHVLPTGGTARFASGLGVHTFLKAQQVVSYSPSALLGVSNDLHALAIAEDLPAHAQSVHVRIEDR